MAKLDRYIGSTVLLNIVVVAMIILGLDLLFAFIGELDDVERKAINKKVKREMREIFYGRNLPEME